MFTIRKTIVQCIVFYCNLSTENASYKAVHTHVRMYPEDEHKMFETCRREEEKN